MSDTVIEAAPSTDPLAGLSPAQLGEWRLTGKFPEASSDETDAPASLTSSSDSSPDTPAQAASTDAQSQTASEPVTSAADTPSHKSKKANAETRKAELHAEIQDLLKQRSAIQTELASLRQPPRRDVPAESSPATPPALQEIVTRPDPSKPALSETEFFAAYPEASYGEFVRYTTRYEQAALRAEDARAQQVRTREQRVQQRIEGYVKRVSEAQASDPSFKIAEALLLLKPDDMRGPNEPLTAGHVIAQEILESEQAPALLRHLTEHPEDLASLQALDTPLAVSKAMARLEARLDSTLTPPKPVVKTTTSAPTPPKTLGTKTAEPVDDVSAALASGDVARYIRAKNAQEAAALRS